MNLTASYRSELLKTRRTASFWLSIIGAGFIPGIFLIAYLTKPDGAANQLKAAPWQGHLMWGWNALSSFLLPMFVVLISALVPQIEYKNNTWKQVYASPQSYGQIFFSKMLAIHTMLLFFYISFNLFLIGSGVAAALVHPQFTFLQHAIDWQQLLSLNVKMYISTLGIAALQYWLSLRFKNFIAPVGIGLALLIGAIIARSFGWEHIYKFPFAHPSLSFSYLQNKPSGWLQPHEWNALGYFVFFTLVGFLDTKYRKEKG